MNTRYIARICSQMTVIKQKFPTAFPSSSSSFPLSPPPAFPCLSLSLPSSYPCPFVIPFRPQIQLVGLGERAVSQCMESRLTYLVISLFSLIDWLIDSLIKWRAQMMQMSDKYDTCPCGLRTHGISSVKGKGKGRYSSSWEPHLRATGRHLPYGITVLPTTRHKLTCPA